MTTISLRQLSHKFGQRDVLSNITTDLPKQKLNAVIGPNGSGKTTLLKILSGIYQIQNGGISGLDAKHGHKIIWIPAHIEMPFAYTVEEVVRMLMRPWLTEATARANIAAALGAAELPDFGPRVFNSLSSGEQHRIALGAAIASGAETLILDEPCANLDIGAAHRFMKKLRREAQQGRTLIISIHDLTLAYAHCDHILLLNPSENTDSCVSGATDDVFHSDALKSAFQIKVTFADAEGKRLPAFAPLED